MDLKKNWRDIITMSILMIISVMLYFVFIPTEIPLRSSWSGDVVFNSRTFPNILAISLFVVSFIGLLGGIKKIIRLKVSEAEIKKETNGNRFAVFIPFVVFALAILYGVLFIQIGYIGATIIVPPIIMFILKCRKWQYYFYVYVFAALIYVMFEYVLLVPLP